MSTTSNVMTIWADHDLQEKFKSIWYMYNATNKQKITQAEFLEKLLDNYIAEQEKQR